MLGIYLSGTGNTKHCVGKLAQLLDTRSQIMPIEDEQTIKMVREDSFLVLGYPTQFSNMPIMVRDFIISNASVWKGKKVLCLSTMGAFSGDGTGCAARLLKKYGANVVGGIQVRMPNSICDTKRIPPTDTEKKKIMELADRKIEAAAVEICKGRFPKEGLGVFDHIAGLLGQRLWFRSRTSRYSDEIKINDFCNGCGLCQTLCPTQNLRICNGKAVQNHQCTMCYRCIHACPQKAITLLGTKVHEG